MIEFLEYICIFFAVGNYISNIVIVPETNLFGRHTIVAGLGVFCGIVNAALPMQEINERMFRVREAEPLVKSYEEAEK